MALVCAIAFSLSLPAQSKRSEPEAFKFAQMLFYIDNLYVDTVDLHRLTEKAIVNMLNELDPHSAYIPSEDVKRANEGIKGNFEGIGISYQMIADTIVVNQTIAGCPAEKVGMLPGDRIIRVDSTTVSGVKMKMNRVPELIRGPKGSKVEITAIRRGEKREMVFRIVRDKIPLHSVDAAFYVAPGIGYIKTNSFSATTTAEMSAAIEELKSEGNLTALVIDLQGNGGGVMSAAIDMVNRFVEPGKLIVYTEGEHQRRENAMSSAAMPKLTTLPLAVLIDEYSASASEIVSGALQDWDRATVIGRRTFGKGLVQRPLRLSDGSEVRLTVARYYTPSGRNIQKPYDNGTDSYFRDIEKRYRHGEMINPDSIHFPDSLRYSTLVEGRTVYGGGGIFPDIFVPLDTTRYTRYHREVVAKGIFNKSISNYVDTNRKQLKAKYPTIDLFLEKYEVPSSLTDKITNDAANEKIEATDALRAQSLPLMTLQAKAVIAQSLFDTEAFYRVMQTNNDALQRAIRHLTK